MTVHFTDATGWVGMAMLLIAYARRGTLPGRAYNAFNVAGAVLLVVVCVAREAWPPAVLNVIWAGIGLRDMRRGVGKRE